MQTAKYEELNFRSSQLASHLEQFAFLPFQEVCVSIFLKTLDDFVMGHGCTFDVALGCSLAYSKRYFSSSFAYW